VADRLENHPRERSGAPGVPTSERAGEFEGQSPSSDLEPERYELTAPPQYAFELPDVNRREFLRLFSAVGGGLIVIASMPDALAQESGRAQAGQAPIDVSAWIHIDERGRVTAYTGKVEIGQNIRTSLSQVVADELRVPIESVTFVMADTDLTPFDQGTFGSRTTPAMAPQLARAAATAREILIDQAAARWQVERSSLRVADGQVTAAGGRSIPYGELTAGKRIAGRVTGEPAPHAQWALRGKPVRKVQGRDFVTGAHVYTPDLVRPNLAFGCVVRPPAYGARLQRVDDRAARALNGVTVVRDGEFLGVVAPTDREARRAVAAVQVEWTTPGPQPDTTTVYAHLKKTGDAGSGGGRGGGARPQGDVVAARASSARVFEASYQIPYIAHVPLEPRAAVAEWTDGKVTVWTGTQRPFGVRGEVASAFSLAEDRVRVIVPDMGSGYGGKHTGEQAIEAARLARGAGRPVKLVYARDEEFSWGYFRPAGVIDIKAGVDGSGRLTFWEFDNWNSGNSGLATPYVVANKREAFHSSDSPLRQGSYRGLAATANHYAREMHMDAVARALGVDAVAFRLTHLENPRIRAVLTAAAETSGWPRASRSDRALGIACGTEKGSYIATAAEVARSAGGFTVTRIVAVFECGAIVNQDGLHNQVEGSIVQGLGGALFEVVKFAEGQLLNGTMQQYRVPRFKDIPPIEIVLLDRPDLPSAGAGETPIVCVAPAIGSAVRNFGEVKTELPVSLSG
jgi:isoquinoline 1-oxidoreductase